MVMSMSDIQFAFALLVTFQIKHFIGDFLLQTSWMVRGKSQPGVRYMFPLAVHVLVHALATFAIVMVVNPNFWYLALLDFAVHFLMDRIKSGPQWFGRYADTDKRSFWIPFGIDQMVHHCTHYFIIWLLLMAR